MSRTSRSRTGCLTCRKRKKKCDEASFPTCQNCASKSLPCDWPALKHELHSKEKEAKYISEAPKQSQAVHVSFAPPSQNNPSDYLRKIAMQEDIAVPGNVSPKKAPSPLRSIQLQGAQLREEYVVIDVFKKGEKNRNGK